ncbi:hypothetical protein GF337_02310 [candidate division KSB1 bacterium]|nr:hypothetical protein [candidate division KSB1 bacterium]
MDFKFSKDQFHHIEIPDIFYSQASQKMFSYCIECNKYLLEDGVQYLIEKAIKRYPKFESDDTVFEYAICMDCYDEMRKSFSEISLKRIEEYFNSNVDWVERRMKLLHQKEPHLQDWLSNCLVKNTAAEELTEYQIACHCDGKDMLFSFLPYLISAAAMDEIANLLSNKTLDAINGFRDRFTKYPPELQDLLTGRPVMLL